TLFRFRKKFAVGILLDELLIFLFGAHSMGEVAVRLLHLLVVDVGDLELRLGGLGHVGEESLEIAIVGFGLCKSGAAAFGVPRIGFRKLGARDEFGIRIGVDQGLQNHPGLIEAVVLHLVHGAVEQHLVGLLGAYVREGIVDLLVRTGCRNQQQSCEQKDQRTTM